MKFEISFTGHENIVSLHPKTIEITKDSRLTTRGDCIIGVNAKYSCNDIPQKMKKKLQDPNSVIKISLLVNDSKFLVIGKGHPSLTLSHLEDIVIRKSKFTCPRTLAVECNYASDTIPRNMIKQLQNSKTKGSFVIEVS